MRTKSAAPVGESLGLEAAHVLWAVGREALLRLHERVYAPVAAVGHGHSVGECAARFEAAAGMCPGLR